MGTNYYAVRTRPTIERPIHIGKSSGGWKFNFQTHNDEVTWNTYNQVIDWLTKHTVEKEEYVILDEYDEKIDLADFIEMVRIKQKESHPDDFTYSRNVDGYRFTDEEFC